MELHDAMKSVLKFLCFENKNICRLCLRSTGEGGATLDSIYHIQTHYVVEMVSFLDMFLELGRNETVDVFVMGTAKEKHDTFAVEVDRNLPNVLCQDCSSTTINSYMFKKLCHYSNQAWTHTLNKLHLNSLNENNIGPTTETLFITTNTENMFYSSKTSMNKDKKKAALKLNSIINNRENVRKKKLVHKITDDKESYQCPHCFKTISTLHLLNEHIERLHAPKVLRCELCEKKFSTHRLLKYHYNSHHIPVNCKLCNKKLPSKYTLKLHMDKHEGTTCHQCNKTYESKMSFKLHLKICGQSDREQSFFCDICGKGYIRKNGLRSHLKIDHGFGKVLSCKWCSKKFDAISRLNNHIVKHTKEKKFHCEYCGGKFVTLAALTYHQRLHTGEKPFPCDLCNERFLSASRRMEHKHRKHFGPSKQCTVCQAKFISGFQLKKHIERHNNPQSKLYVVNREKLDQIEVPDTSFLQYTFENQNELVILNSDY